MRVREKVSHPLVALVWVAALLALPAPGAAQTPLSSWDQVIPDASQRFVVLGAFNDEAVLDKETGLVWEREPADTLVIWRVAVTDCYERTILITPPGPGPQPRRKGWRLPTIEELSSLADGAGLLPGHPFVIVDGLYYSITTAEDTGGQRVWTHHFNDSGNGFLWDLPKNTQEARAWCVRGGHGYDAFN